MKLSKQEQREKARAEYWRKRELIRGELNRKLREIEAEDDDDS